ncbi:hypothetical protein P691DRAFT_254271 [Macrolepiota fuliginosa MF-IS2]|uniref:EF-hand domain-containing protein n=1 Tax=Macrolepiota fuliginosa MF-IS2 TaxID=1400762 RepID=A0A9P6BZ08_9AGAR|nr:hypothetical protein P691DRAFT_254271 [Macrolepiota fuliginosa MF-IS2]
MPKMSCEDMQKQVLLRYAPISLPLRNIYVNSLIWSQYVCDRFNNRGSISHKDLSNVLAPPVVAPPVVPPSPPSPHKYHLRPRNRDRHHPYHRNDHQTHRRPQRIPQGTSNPTAQTQTPPQLPKVPKVLKTTIARLFITRDANVDGHLDKNQFRRLLEDLDKEYWAREVWVIACQRIEREIDDYLGKFGVLPVPSGDLIDGKRGAKYMADSGAGGTAGGKRRRGSRCEDNDVFDESCRWSGSKEALGRFVATLVDRYLPAFELKRRVEALEFDQTTVFTFEMAMNVVNANPDYTAF